MSMYPPIFHATSEPVTEAMRNDALLQCRDTMKKLDEIRKGLELPPEQLPLVAEIYSHHLSIAVVTAEGARHKRRQKKIAEWMKNRPAETHQNLGSFGGYGRVMPVGALDPELPDFDDEEDV